MPLVALVHHARSVWEGGPDDLEARTDGEHGGASGDSPRQRSIGPQSLGRQHLRTILATAQAEEVRLRKRFRRAAEQQLSVEATAPGPSRKDDPISCVAVGAEQIGVDDSDAERGHEASRRSRKAV